MVAHRAHGGPRGSKATQVEAAAFLVPSERGDAGGRGARALALYRRVALAWACSPRTLGATVQVPGGLALDTGCDVESGWAERFRARLKRVHSWA